MEMGRVGERSGGGGGGEKTKEKEIERQRNVCRARN